MSIFAPFFCLFLSSSLSRKSLLFSICSLVSSPVCSTTRIPYLIFLPSLFSLFLFPHFYNTAFFNFLPFFLSLPFLLVFTPIPHLRKFVPCFYFVSPAVTPLTCRSQRPYCVITCSLFSCPSFLPFFL